MNIIEYNMRLDENRLPILAETSTKYKIDGRMVYSTPDLLAQLCSETIGLRYAAEEYTYCIVFDAKNRIIGVFEAGHGAKNCCQVDVRGLLQKSLFLDACNIAITHNHPSGDAAPSQEDFDITKRVKGAADLIGITLIDHIIVGDGKYYSFAANETL